MKTLLALFLFSLWSHDVVAQTSFYEGKTVKIIVGYPAGTTHDTWARLSAQYMNKPNRTA